MDSRTVHIDSGAEWRGGQRQLYLLALEQRDRGVEPLVVSQPRSRLVTQLRRAGVASAGVRMRARWDLAAVRKIRRLIRTWQPAVLHVHDHRALALAQTALVGLDGVPALVFTCRAVPPRVGAIRRNGPRPARFTAPNKVVFNYLISLGAQASRIDVVPPGVIPVPEVRARNWRRECRWPEDAIVCGVIGAEGARVRASLRGAMQHLPENARDKLRIVLLGGAPSGEGRLAGIPAFSAGFVDEIAPAIAGLDFLCNLSGAESMSTAVLDAMALRVPPVAYEAGGVGEYIEHGRSGLVVPWGDAVAFAAAVSSLVTDGELRRTLAALAPGRASRFSVANMADALEGTYRKARQSGPAVGAAS